MVKMDKMVKNGQKQLKWLKTFKMVNMVNNDKMVNNC